TGAGGTVSYTALVTVAGSPSDTINKALNRAATTSSFEGAGLEATKGNDGDGSTRWGSARVDNQWWQVYLGSQTSVNRVSMNWEDAYATQFKISVSVDGVNLIDVQTINLTSPGLYVAQFPTVTALYVRITGITRATPYGISLWEV